MPLLGQRVLLRALEMRDLNPIWEAYKDLDLELTTSGDSPPVSDRQVRAFWKQRIKDPAPEMRYFVIEPLPDHPGAGQFAGMINLYDVDMRNRHAELAIWMASHDLRGQGYGVDAIRALLPYAFEVVRLEKIHLGVYDFNEAGIRAYERVGFRYEGCLRHMLYYEGRYWDEWPMRILRTEWDLISKPPTEGLRPYHPADQDQAIALIQQYRPAKDTESARKVLQRWWRDIDGDTYSFQSAGQLVGLLSIETDNGSQAVVDAVIMPDYQQQTIASLSAVNIAYELR